MLVFIDESGDIGLKIEKGSSRYFILSLVLFHQEEEALACDNRIRLLKKESGFSSRVELLIVRCREKMTGKLITHISRKKS